jgi:phenylacetate-CoA ligase
MYDHEVETRSTEEQFRIDNEQYRSQIKYLYARSPFYIEKLQRAGFDKGESVGSLEQIHNLPFTEKDELRLSQSEQPPFGAHLACPPEDLVRIFSTSGTTGTPCYIGLTSNDLNMFAINVARGYSAAGFRPGQRIVATANAGPFIAGAAYYGLDMIGCLAIPIGTGDTERLVTSIQRLGATGLSCTPSYGLYLIDWCHQHGIKTENLGLTNMITAGEPGGADPMIRNRIEEAFLCQVREAMGIGDISLTVWADDESADGMHFMARDFVHVELIDPDSGRPLPWEDGAQGELVYTALRREAMPLLRFRSRDHVVINMKPNPTGRTGPRIRCIGRTDDMLIVRGVNLFPAAIRSVLHDFSSQLGGMFQIRPRSAGVAQLPPLPIAIELARGVETAPIALSQRISKAIRGQLLITTQIELLPYGTLPRGEYKTSLVDYSFVEQ